MSIHEGGIERRVFRNRVDMYREMGGVGYKIVDYVDNAGEHHKERVLGCRWFALKLSGSVTEFTEMAMRRVLAVAGLARDPKQAADLVLTLSIREPEFDGKMGDLARGLVAVLEKVNVVGKDGILQVRREGEAEREVLELVLGRMDEYSENGGRVSPEDVAAVLWECRVEPNQALEFLKMRFDLNGEAERVVQEVYSSRVRKE